MALPSYAVMFRGKPACPCLAEWLPVFEAELQRRGILAGDLHVYQLIGGARASAGTHSHGGAFDLVDLPGDEDVWVARQMGADATWSRPRGWDGADGIAHVHGVLRGCTHNAPARYQIAAVDAGFNGLGFLGHGGADNGPRPLSGRDWRRGIAWAQAQEDVMQDKDFERIREIVREEVSAELAETQRNGRTMRQNVLAIANKLGVKVKG